MKKKILIYLKRYKKYAFLKGFIFITTLSLLVLISAFSIFFNDKRVRYYSKSLLVYHHCQHRFISYGYVNIMLVILESRAVLEGIYKSKTRKRASSFNFDGFTRLQSKYFDTLDNVNNNSKIHSHIILNDEKSKFPLCAGKNDKDNKMYLRFWEIFFKNDESDTKKLRKIWKRLRFAFCNNQCNNNKNNGVESLINKINMKEVSLYNKGKISLISSEPKLLWSLVKANLPETECLKIDEIEKIRRFAVKSESPMDVFTTILCKEYGNSQFSQYLMLESKSKYYNINVKVTYKNITSSTILVSEDNKIKFFVFCIDS